MIVAMISKEAHAKSHQKELEKHGHKVLMLGGGTPVVAPTVDVIVCRPASCSHHAFDVAMGHKRQGRNVVIANGVTEIIDSVNSLYSGGSLFPASVPLPLKVEPVITLLEDLSVPAWITTMSERLGLYGPLLHRHSVESVVAGLAGKDTKLLAAWKRYLKDKPQSYERIRTDIREDVVAGNKIWPGKTACYYIPERGGVRESHFVVTRPELVAPAFQALEVFATKAEAEAFLAQKKRASVPEPKPKPIPSPVLVAMHAPSSSTLAALVLPSVAAPPAVQPPPVAAPAPVAAPKAVSWDASLRSAIALMLAEMKTTRVTEISIRSDGTVNFKREEVVIVVNEGSMTVGLED